MTLIHVAQTKPEIFFSDETIDLFQEEINRGNLKSENLTPSFRISFKTNEFCEELQENINKAIEVWKMKPYLNSEPRFRACK